MKNRPIDLTNHLFAELERLGDEELTAEQIEVEAKRADAMVAVADKIIANMALQLRAVVVVIEHGERAGRLLAPMIEVPKVEQTKTDAVS